MPFPPDVKEDALIACGRCCCICHKFCGSKVEVAHIIAEADRGPDALDNAIPVCFDCHADIGSYNAKHPKGNKYSEAELRRHRDNWYARVLNNPGVPRGDVSAETDRQVYRRLMAVLPWEGSVAFVRKHDFHRRFAPADLTDLHALVEESDKPGFEFIDPDLEALRGALVTNVWDVLGLTQVFSVQTRDGHRVVPAEWSDGSPFHPEAVDKIDSAVSQLDETYRALVRTATRKLGILPDHLS